MDTRWKIAIWPVVLSVIWVLASWTQDANSPRKRGDPVSVEAEVTYVQTVGSTILELKSAEGLKYRIQIPFGVIAELRRVGFAPEVGEKIRVTGEVICVLADKTVIAGSEITWQDKTYRLAPAPSWT